MEAVLERGHDAEVAAAAAQCPEEIGMLVGAGAQHVAVGGNELERHDVVAREAVFPREPADAAAERQTANTRLRDDAERHRQAEDVRLAIELAEQ